jgi:hypothetical protein
MEHLASSDLQNPLQQHRKTEKHQSDIHGKQVEQRWVLRVKPLEPQVKLPELTLLC